MAIGIKDSIEAAFARHETFTIRYGWLKRGFDNALIDPRLFYREDAHHVLGVGKNMGKSIRFWLSATRLMVEVPDPTTPRRTMLRPTQFGLALLAGAPTTDLRSYASSITAFCGEDVTGLDPFLERLDSWWLIHWMMLSPGGKLPVWWTAFNTFAPVLFTVDALTDHVLAQIESTAAWSNPSAPTEGSVRKDVLAMLRAYAGTSGSRKADKMDDEIDAPMLPMSLISDVGGQYRFTLGRKPGLSPSVVSFACLDFLECTGARARTALVSTLASEIGGPGRAFKLAEREFGELLEEAARLNPDLLSMRAAGSSPVLVIESDMSTRAVASELIRRHYATAEDPAVNRARGFEISTRVVTDREDVTDGSAHQDSRAIRSIGEARLF